MPLPIDWTSLRRQWLGIDLRTLALFRAMLALAVMANLLVLWPDIPAFFDDQGLIPRELAMAGNMWSLFFISGQAWFTHLLFALGFISALALLAGYRARLAALICWLVVVSIVGRVTMLTSGADTQLGLLLFWAMFLPLSARFSVDAALRKTPAGGDNTYASVATLGVMLQVAYLYFFGALLKTGAAWHDGTAIYYAVSAQGLNTPLAAYILHWPELLRGLTHYVYYLELLAIFFLFSPFKNAQCRLLIWPLLVTLHLGFALFLSIGIFPLVSIAGLTLFLPGLFWDKLPRFEKMLQTAADGVLSRLRNIHILAPYMAPHDRPVVFSLSTPASAIAAAALVLALVWSLAGLYRPAQTILPEPVVTLMKTLRLKHRWQLFAPQPPQSSHWTVVEAIWPDGSRADVPRRTIGGASHEKPSHGYAAYDNYRWRKFFSRLNMRRSGVATGKYFCAAAAALHENSLPPEKIIITQYRQATPPPGATEAKPVSKRAHHLPCRAKRR